MGHLWIQTEHNLDHKCPDYGQPLTINMYDQTMISLESCSIHYGRVWSACFCMIGQAVFSKLDSTLQNNNDLFLLSYGGSKVNYVIQFLKTVGRWCACLHKFCNLCLCDVSLPNLIQLDYWYDRQRTPLRDRGRLRNDPPWVPGFLSCCSWMFAYCMSSHIASVKSTARNRTRLFLSPFLISTSRFLILGEVFRNDHVAACSTALRSATEKNEMGSYVTVTCSSKMTQRNSTADWIKF